MATTKCRVEDGQLWQWDGTKWLAVAKTDKVLTDAVQVYLPPGDYDFLDTVVDGKAAKRYDVDAAGKPIPTSSPIATPIK